MTPRSSAIVVSELFPPAVGGSAVLMANIYSRFVDATVTVLTDAVASAPNAPEPAPGVIYRAIATRQWGVMARGALRHHWRVAGDIAALSRPRPALVHAVRALPEGLSALLAQLRSGVPYVCWSHGEEIQTCSTSRELRALMSLVYRRAAAVFANSHHTRALVAALGIPPTRIHVVYPGVDTRRFHPEVDGRAVRQRYAPGAEQVLLTLGRLQRRKGHDVSIRAVALLRERFPKLRYVIAGDGGERQELGALAQQLGVSASVHFTGEIDDQQVPALFAACDVFLMPNRVDGVDLEGFGIVFLEAAASGKVSVGGRSGGVPEAIEAGVTGELVTGEDPSELARVVSGLLLDEPKRLAMARDARARAEARFTWDTSARAAERVHAALAH